MTSLIVLGTCLLAPVAVWLGVRGMSATRDGARRGRWCAVTAVVGGAICTALLIGGVVAGDWIRDLAQGDLDLATGDCVDPLYVDDELNTFDVRPCTAPHDAEVAYSGHLEPAQIADYSSRSAADLCAPLIDDRYREPVASGLFAVQLVTFGDPDFPEPGDTVFCLLTNGDGGPLSEPVGAGA